MTRININTGGRALVRLTFEDANKIEMESNLSPDASREAISAAMEKLAKGAGQADQARSESADLGSRGADIRDIARAMVMMVSELNATLKVPEIDVDLGEWSPTASN